MPNLDEDRFEIYLKEFRPLAPAPLPLDVPAKPTHSRSAVLALLATAAAVTLAIVMLHHRGSQAPAVNSNSNSSAGDLPAISQPLTLGAANQLLVNSPSFEAALDSLESEPGAVAIPKGRESALAVLSEENLKP